MSYFNPNVALHVWFSYAQDNHFSIPADSASGLTGTGLSEWVPACFSWLTYVENPVSWAVPPPALQLLMLSVLQSPVVEHYTEYALKEGQCQSTQLENQFRQRKLAELMLVEF